MRIDIADNSGYGELRGLQGLWLQGLWLYGFIGVRSGRTRKIFPDLSRSQPATQPYGRESKHDQGNQVPCARYNRIVPVCRRTEYPEYQPDDPERERVIHRIIRCQCSRDVPARDCVRGTVHTSTRQPRDRTPEADRWVIRLSRITKTFLLFTF